MVERRNISLLEGGLQSVVLTAFGRTPDFGEGNIEHRHNLSISLFKQQQTIQPNSAPSTPHTQLS